MGFGIRDVFLIFLLLSSVQPIWQKRQIEFRRFRALQDFQQQRKSRVILLIHRQESISLLGIPISRYITIEDSNHGCGSKRNGAAHNSWTAPYYL